MSSYEQEIEDVNYSLPKLSRSKWIIAIALFFVFSTLLYFPFSDKIDRGIKAAVASIPGCPISFDDYEVSLFLPKIKVHKLNIPRSCFGKFGDPIALKEATLYFRGVSFAPFGPHFKLETELMKNPIEAYITAGPMAQAINISDNTINLSNLRTLIPEVTLSGDVKLNALVKMDSKGIYDLKVLANSKNVSFPSQSVMNFKLPNIPIKNLLVKAHMKDKKIIVDDVVAGNTDSPIRANLKGNIKTNKRNIQNSPLNLRGEVAFSDSFLEKLPLIKLFMNKFTRKDKFYQIKVKGTLNSPTVN